MKKTNKNKVTVVTVLFLSIFLILFNNIKVSLADADNNDLTVENLEFQFIEFSDDKGTIENISSVEIELPSSTWNLTHIEMNFTDIEFTREIAEIEDEPYTEKNYIDKTSVQGLAVQIQINAPTILYGVQIYANATKPHSRDEVFIQIHGYDSVNNRPNTTVLREVSFNISANDLRWYIVNFSTPLLLSKGNYFLVLVADIQAAAKYDWYYNKRNPKNPDLYISNYTASGWSIGVNKSPYLYKLDQEILGDFYPEKYNMTAEIGGFSYKIFNGMAPGSGNLKISGMEFSPDKDDLHIPINNNISDGIFFNLSYDISLKNNISADGSVIIKENSNDWSIIPPIKKTGVNYTVKFKYPDTWENFTIFKYGEEIFLGTDYIDDANDNVIYILNATIPEGIIPWEITANSIKSDPILSIQKLEYSIGEEILIEVSPPLNGRYTFILYALGIEKYRDIKIYPSETIIFSYNLTSTAVSGNWTAYIYWNNETDAGVETQEFKIFGISPIINGGGGGGGSSSDTKSNGIEPILGIIVIVGIAVGAGGSLATYQTVKSIKKKRDLHTQTLYNKFRDNLSLNYLMISDHKSGLNVYEQFFTGKSLDPSLLSGFLEAIRNFGIELTGAYQKSETVKLEYQNSKILMNDKKDFRLIIIMSENPSEGYIKSITNLADEIERVYGDLLRNFRGGDVTRFSDIRGLIEKHLSVKFTYPLRIVERKGMKLTRAEKLIIQRARVIMKQTNLKHFYSTFLMPDQEYDPEKTKIIFNLIDKGIFQPININLTKNNNNLKYK